MYELSSEANSEPQGGIFNSWIDEWRLMQGCKPWLVLSNKDRRQGDIWSWRIQLPQKIGSGDIFWCADRQLKSGMPVKDEALNFGGYLNCFFFYGYAKQWYLSRYGLRPVCSGPDAYKAVQVAQVIIHIVGTHMAHTTKDNFENSFLFDNGAMLERPRVPAHVFHLSPSQNNSSLTHPLSLTSYPCFPQDEDQRLVWQGRGRNEIGQASIIFKEKGTLRT